MDTPTTPYDVHQCWKCSGNTRYYCKSCLCDLCLYCKEKHFKDLTTIAHNVVTYRKKHAYTKTQENCAGHTTTFFEMYCDSCKVPVCCMCSEHRQHRLINIQNAYKTKRQQHRGTIHTIRYETLLYRPILQTRIEADFESCYTNFSIYQSRILTKAKEIKDLIDYVKHTFMCNVFCDVDFKHSCLNQKTEMTKHIVSLQEYEHRYVQPAFTFSALQFHLFIKTARLSQIHFSVHTSKLSMTKSLNKKDVMEFLSGIQITEKGHRSVGCRYKLRMMDRIGFCQSFMLTGVDSCNHISCMASSDRLWVSDVCLILTNTAGFVLHRVADLCIDSYGAHTLNSENELIYIDSNYNIKKLSNDMETTTTFLKISHLARKARCVYWSPSTGDLLIGTYIRELDIGHVMRYNKSGRLTQITQLHNRELKVCGQPNFITENTNGDIVVSNCTNFTTGVVVAKDRSGKHRFYYTGTKSEFRPRGICTDALSHILVYDDATRSINVLHRDGKLLTRILEDLEIVQCSLSYNSNTHQLWVGLENNELYAFRYIDRTNVLTGEFV